MGGWSSHNTPFTVRLIPFNEPNSRALHLGRLRKVEWSEKDAAHLRFSNDSMAVFHLGKKGPQVCNENIKFLLGSNIMEDSTYIS